jgi:hypothetical protein
VRSLSAAVFAASLAFAGAARADDQPFLNLDATDIEPQYAYELEQNVGWATGLTGRAYNAISGVTEIEYGLTDRLQLAILTSYGWDHEHEHLFPAVPSVSSSEWGGIEGEAIFQAMNVYFDPIGLGFLVAAGAGPNSRAVEAQVLVQKNYFNDRLRLVANIGGELGSEKDGAWSDVSALIVSAGAAYNITWEWSAGLEFNAEHEFDGLLINGRGVPGVTTYFLGPTIQYVAHPWTASLGFQVQLPWAQDPSHAPGSVTGGYLANAERTRVALRITRDLY